MNPSTNPIGLPDETMPQAPEAPSTGGGSTGTMAAPADYAPSRAQQSLRGLSAEPVHVPQGELIGMAGRYALLRALAKGGMGQVSVARDTELDRDVALKEIQQKFKLDGATLHRFTLEARVTGRLEHPGVVPVYGLGTYPDGRPYYAMRFITGRSFQEAIEEFHAKESPNRDPQERSLALRQLLRRFIDVCNTIGYAHSRGILHRDIKPANVMLGNFGETLVVDWGLAKEMFEGAATPAPVSDETMLHTPAIPEGFQETQDGFTMYGQTMGTPAYMSPEQAAGKWDITGVASDVYSLGASLYAVLSGTPPYSGPSFEVITRVQRGEYKPVKLVKTSVDGPLDAIVQKAMAFDIKDRYPNALALATDVERWLADEPVSCFREPLSVRVGRWAKRHRTLVTAGSAVALASIIALTVGLIAVNAERKRTELAKDDASKNRDSAREALLTLTDDAVGEVLASSQKPTPQQIKFLDGLIEMYRRFAMKQPDGPETKLFTAGAWYRIGRIEARIERYPKAIEAYQTADTLLKDPEIAGLADAQKTRGEAQLYQGIVYLQQYKPEAEAHFAEAATIFRALIASDPKPRYRFLLAQADDRLGTLYMTQRKYADAEKQFNDSLKARLALAGESPDDPEFQFRLAQSFRQLAAVCFSTGKVKEGREYAANARAIQEKIVAGNRTSTAYLALLADIDTLLTAHYTLPRRSLPTLVSPTAVEDSLAVIHARNASRTWGQLVALNPGDSKFRRSQAEANINLARQCQDNGQPREALSSLEAALNILMELNADEPGNEMTLVNLAQALVAQQSTLRVLDDPKAAAAAENAVKAAEDLAAKFPANPVARQHAATARIERGLLKIKAKALGEAKADLDASWAHLRDAAGSGNGEAVPYYVRALADWMHAADDFGTVAKSSEAVATLKLAKGQGWFEAACLHGRVADLLLRTPGLDDEWQKFAVKQLGESIHCLSMAVTNGFDRVDLLQAEPDLQRVREVAEFADVLDRLKPKPTRKDN